MKRLITALSILLIATTSYAQPTNLNPNRKWN